MADANEFLINPGKLGFLLFDGNEIEGHYNKNINVNKVKYLMKNLNFAYDNNTLNFLKVTSIFDSFILQSGFPLRSASIHYSTIIIDFFINIPGFLS